LWFDNHLIQFTTYNLSSLKKAIIDADKIEIELENKNYSLNVFAMREPSTELASPISGKMDGRIEKNMNTFIDVVLTDRKSGKVISNDTGRNGCLEIAGEIEKIIIK